MKTQIITSLCIHHWVIEIANGPISEGKCNFCGSLKTFDNTIGTERELSAWKVGKANANYYNTSL